jgi:subtilisin
MDDIKFIPDEDLVVHKVDFVQLSQTQNWGVDVCKINEAWKVSRGKGVKVAVLDTGITPHLDLEGQWNQAFNCTSDPDYTDGSSHGSHVAGIIAATDNDQGVIGIAPECFIIPIKVLSNNGSGSYDFIAKGLRTAIDAGADIINMSLGASVQPPQMIHDLIKEAVSRGIIILAAAGNDAKEVNWPARYEEVIAVAALDQKGAMAHFSSRGEQVKTVAPGVQIYSTVPTNQYGMMSGTSQACPFVAGVCALILAHSRNTPGAKPIIDYVDMLKALDTLCDNTPYLQTGDAKNWGFGIPKFANIDWSSI